MAGCELPHYLQRGFKILGCWTRLLHNSAQGSLLAGMKTRQWHNADTFWPATAQQDMTQSRACLAQWRAQRRDWYHQHPTQYPTQNSGHQHRRLLRGLRPSLCLQACPLRSHHLLLLRNRCPMRSPRLCLHWHALLALQDKEHMCSPSEQLADCMSSVFACGMQCA